MGFTRKYPEDIRQKCCTDILKGKSYENVSEKFGISDQILRNWMKQEFVRIANDETISIESLKDEKDKKVSKVMKLNRQVRHLEKILELKNNRS